MEIISNSTHDEIKKAANALKDGHLVAFPTETVYGLGADATNEKAVSRIYAVKGRPTDHPLIVHISSINQLEKWAIEIPEYAIKLAEEFWPGPMTLILKRSELAKNFITGAQDNVGIRVPAHPLAFELISQFEKLGGLGIVAPSANRFGAVSPTNSNAVHEELSNYLCDSDQILDGGQCIIGIESTIISCLAGFPIVFRPGLVSLKQISNVTGINERTEAITNSIKVPGILPVHYSPKANVLLQGFAKRGDGFIAFAHIKTPEGSIRLASPKTIDQFAKELYESLRLADQKGLKNIIVIPPEGDGLAFAIRERLNKAAENRID